MKIILCALFVLVAGCASHDPAQIPTIDLTKIPSLSLKGLNPQNVSLVVENSRESNIKAGNAADVVASVRAALVAALDRGGLGISADSQNKLHLQIRDCKNVDPNGACVEMALGLKAPRFEVEVSGFSSNGMTRNGSSAIPGMGNFEQAYETTLQMVIEALPRKVEQFLKR